MELSCNEDRHFEPKNMESVDSLKKEGSWRTDEI